MLTGLAAGSVVAGYRVESRIGAGGMAMVFRARDESLGRTVALKVLAPALADDADFRERFIRESRAAAVVDHPHIIPVYGAGEFNGVLYLAMRYVAGGDLRALLKREGPLPPSRAAFLLSPLASALDAGHAAGLVHRDVKPANILIDTSPGRPDHLYLSDFGLAKGNATTGLTGTGQFLGTLDYCAPEQIGGKPARPQTDQYALGCVAYTMFTGTVPFPRDEVTAVLWAHMSEPPPQVTRLRPDLPAAVDAVLAKAMAKDPEERYPTCTEFADAIRAALGVDAYTTPSSVYTADGTDLPPAGGGGPAGPASPALPVPVPPSPISTPPGAPDPALPPREAAVPGSAASAHAPTESGSSLGFADTERRTITPPGGSLAPEVGPDRVGLPARRRRRGVLAVTAIVLVTGGVAAAVLALSSQGSPPAKVTSSPPPSTASSPTGSGASSAAASTAGTSPPALAALAEPGRAAPTGVAFKSDGTLVTVDSAGAYSWDITASRVTQTDYASAQVLTSMALHVVGKLALIEGTGQNNVVQVWNIETNKVVATLAAPNGTVVEADALSPDGTEAAFADGNGNSYVWKIAG
jgi:serine/threonine protein kinase